MSYTGSKPTAFDRITTINEHMHSASLVYPTSGAGVTVTAAAGANTLGNFAEIVPVNTITSPFDIHWLNVETVSAADIYILVLYAGEVEITRARFSVLGTPANIIIPSKRTQTEVQPANTQIQAKLMTVGGGGDNCSISIEYHTY